LTALQTLESAIDDRQKACYANSMGTLELQLPRALQEVLKARATAHARSIEDEARLLLEAALSQSGLPSDDEQLKQLAVLDDNRLWQIAKQRVSLQKSERMQALIDRQQAEGLTPDELEEVKRLQHYAQRMMLLRAEAAALLKRRGHDIESLRSQL